MFWGLLLEEGKFYSQKVTKPFHVSMAALEPSGKGGGNPITVNLEQDGMDFILCTLKEDSIYQQAVDLNFAQNDEIKFFLSGKGTVHLTGYVVSDEESDDELEDESDEEPPQLTEAATKKPKETEKVSNKKPAKEAKEESEDSEEESDEDSDEDSEEETNSPPQTKKPAVVNKKGKVEKETEKAVATKKGKKVEADEDSDEDDSDDESDDGKIDFKKLMQEDSSGDDDDDDDDDDIDMDEMEDEGEEEESEDDSSEEEDSPPKKVKKTPVTPNTDTSKQKEKGKTPPSSFKETKKEKSKPTPEPVQSGKKRKEVDSPLVNGVDSTPPKKSKKNKSDKEKPQESPQPRTPKRTIKGGIVVEDLKVGTGPETVTGKYVNVYYTGKLKSNNQQFDSNTSGKGFKFRLGGNEVIKGWDFGVAGMKVGGKRRLTIPYKMAYGDKGNAPEIPPKADLVFEVELRNVH